MANLSPGEGAGRFLGDLANNASDAVMRQRWEEGHYGTGKNRPETQFITQWRKQAGRG